MIMLSHNYPFLKSLFSSFIITIHLLLQTCIAKTNHHCPPSSCGNITDISYPFRPQNDPKHCGNPKYQLACENNTTVIYLEHSLKYVVREINYTLHTIRIADSAIKENDICSFPNSFVGNHYSIEDNYFFLSNMLYKISIRPVTFMTCPYPVINNSLLLEPAEHCGHGFNESDRKHKYIRLGHLNGSYFMDNCTIDLKVMTSVSLYSDDLSAEQSEKTSVSLLEIHSALLNGLEVSWTNALCDDGCKKCSWDGKSASCVVGGHWCNVANIWWFRCGGMPVWFLNAFSIYGTRPYLALRSIIGMACMLWLLIYILRRRHLSTFDVIEGFLQSNNDLMPIRYSYKDIKKMTRGFKEKLGQGGYGSVYKGKLRSGHIVAVKLLNKPKENGQDFINEIATIGRIHHVNVVKLVGFCAGRFNNKRALVFDFMPNGSLEKHIFRKQNPKNPLSWERIYEIAVGVARGIEYLHRGCDIQILHFDIKPHNILLDDNFTPKVSDFGLAKLYSTENNTVTLTAARGTIGYVAPELINRSLGGVSYKADVYSFGMLLMEMVGLNREIAANEEESSKYFPQYIYDRFNKGKDIETRDADINDDDDDSEGHAKKITRKMTIVGLWCIEMSPADQPSMSEVVKMLESDENLQIPPQPSESTQTVNYSSDQTWEIESSGSMAVLGDYTSSDVSNGGTSCIQMS